MREKIQQLEFADGYPSMLLYIASGVYYHIGYKLRISGNFLHICIFRPTSRPDSLCSTILQNSIDLPNFTGPLVLLAQSWAY